MEIIKIYSEIEGTEKLYSVLMDEDEFKLFSELQKEFGNKANKLARRIRETGLSAEELAQHDKIQKAKWTDQSLKGFDKEAIKRSDRISERAANIRLNEKYSTVPKGFRSTADWDRIQGELGKGNFDTLAMTTNKERLARAKSNGSLDAYRDKRNNVLPKQQSPISLPNTPKPNPNISNEIINTNANKVGKFIKNPKALKIGGGVAAGLAVAGTGAYLYNKNKKKKNQE